MGNEISSRCLGVEKENKKEKVREKKKRTNKCCNMKLNATLY